MQSPRTVVDLFRKAVSAGAFSEAEQFLESYRREVESSWNAAASDDQRLAIAMDVRATFEWARITTLAVRSHTQRKLILLSRDSAYAPSLSNQELLHLEA